MYKQCFTEKSMRRQREIEAVLLEAMVAKRYDDITISDICQTMNMPRKSFYRYFSSKDGALFALIDHMIMDFRGEIFSDERRATLSTLERFFEFWREKKLFLDALERSGFRAVLVERAISMAREEDILSKRFFSTASTNDAKEYMVNFLISGLMSMVLQWHQSGFDTDPAQMALAVAQLLTRPLLTVSWNK